MANDRIVFACRDCGERFTIYKYYPSHGYTPESWTPERIGDFIQKHVQECRPNGFAMDLGDDCGFVLLTEAQELAFDHERAGREMPDKLVT